MEILDLCFFISCGFSFLCGITLGYFLKSTKMEDEYDRGNKELNKMTCQDCKMFHNNYCVFAGGVTADCEINLCCDNLFTPKDAPPIVDTNRYEFAEVNI